MSGARGLSLIEMVIVVGIVALIAVPLTDLLRGYYRLFYTQQAAVEVTASAGAIAREAHVALLQADRIVASHSFSGTSYASGTTTLVLQLPATDASGNVLTGAYDYIGFYATGTDAYMATDAAAGSARVSGVRHLSAALLSLSFSYNAVSPAAATSTGVDVVTQGDVRGVVLRQHLTGTTTLRNI